MKRTPFLAVLVSALAMPGAVFAQAVICGAPANCTTNAGVKTCTEQWQYTLDSGTIAGGYNNTLTQTTGAATFCSVTGNTQTRTFRAQRPTTAAETGACNFAGNFDFGGGTNSYTCTIDESSGLPVELMEFSADEEVES